MHTRVRRHLLIVPRHAEIASNPYDVDERDLLTEYGRPPLVGGLEDMNDIALTSSRDVKASPLERCSTGEGNGCAHAKDPHSQMVRASRMCSGGRI